MRTKGSVADRQPSSDLKTVRLLVNKHKNLGGELRPALLEAIGAPSGGTFRKMTELVHSECKRLNIKRGLHAVSRLRWIAGYLTVEQLEFICSKVRENIKVEEQIIREVPDESNWVRTREED